MGIYLSASYPSDIQQNKSEIDVLNFFNFFKQINYGGELELKIHPFLTWIFAAECNNGEREDSL